MSSSAGSELMTELRPLSEEMKIEAHLVELEAMGYTIGARRCMAASCWLIAAAGTLTLSTACLRSMLCASWLIAAGTR
jgi:hypothetical protein